MAVPAGASEGLRGPFVTPEAPGGPQHSMAGPSAFASTANVNATTREDPATVQDTNFAVFFAHFLRVYKGPSEPDDDAEPLEAAEGLPAEIAEFYYLRTLAILLQRPRSVNSLLVRLRHLEGWAPQGAPVEDAGLKLAHHIRRNFISISGIRCSMLGSLICLKGLVTRTTDVRPELTLGAFRCEDCGRFSGIDFRLSTFDIRLSTFDIRHSTFDFGL
ncbi:hypothetical protein, conserved [Eimeria brunetti]|uniref:MCM OB domain-containing protein n=1 Tax=Eimeria brunetti TaxID=51314 RepID=U6LF29_9EIME|nr:hypothetical protein, conserved [Eimeria brunetti]